MAGYYPVFLDLKGKKCVVVGGGSVAERKVGMLLECEALVTVISPKLSLGLQQLAEQGTVQAIRRKYRSGDLKDAFLVIAATDDEAINSAVAEQGIQQCMLINVVDDPKASNFMVPSIVRRGDIVLAIGTTGKSPALARKIRTNLELTLPQEYASIASIVSKVRQELIERKISVDGDKWQRCLDIDLLLELVRKGQFDEAHRRLLADLLTADARI